MPTGSIGASGADSALQSGRIQTKARIADAEVNAASGARFRDVKGALSDPAVSRRIKNESIAVGILVTILIAAFVFVLFFVLD